MSRGHIVASFDLENAWEVWRMSIAEEDIPEGGMTPEWISTNLHLFEFEDKRDSGEDGMTIILDEIDITVDPKATE